ncbi:MAG TPA: hypothetical protein VI423_11325, partial [Paenisporosarcina sp.]|nr:hypothetical protein [Paenisporosarcina sp.]
MEKFAHEFNKSKNRRDGLSYACKTCNSVYARCHYQCNKEDQKLKARIRRENIANNPAQIIIIEKLCSYCKIKKPVCDFGKDKYSVDKYINKCKQCKNELIRAQNRPEIERRKIERHNKIANRSAKKCNTCLLVKCLDEFYKNKNSVDNHVNTCKDCCRSLIDSDTYREERREYRLKNREKSNATQRKWYARRVLIDPTFRLRKAASKAIRCALKRAGGSKHGDSILQHLPYTLAELKTHIESQW